MDLAYWYALRERGSVNCLINGLDGFHELGNGEVDAFADRLPRVWSGESEGFYANELARLRRRPSRIRAALNWWYRRRPLRDLLAGLDLEYVAKNHPDELEALDSSYSRGVYHTPTGWEDREHSGAFFGVSHAMLGRTAYLKQLAAHEPLKRVFFIHDTIPCDFPQFCRKHEGLRHLLRIRNAFRYGTHLVVNSNYTLERLENWRLLMALPERPMEVIPIGLEPRFVDGSDGDAQQSGRSYFVVLGTIEPRKNHMLLLEVWKNFVATLPEAEVPQLKVVGGSGWDNDEVMKLLSDDILRPHVEHLDALADNVLRPLLQRARAMLFPSFVEGWGMPMVEALGMRVPVIASDIPAFHEAGQGVPELHDPTDKEGWSQAILEHAQDTSPAREAQLHRMNTFVPPTWEDHFRQLEKFVGTDALS